MALVLKSNRAVLNTGDALSIYDTFSAQDVISTFQARVAADGGEIVDANFLTSVANFLVSNKLLGKVHTVASASLAVKRSMSGAVEKVYNLVGSNDLIMYARTVTNGDVTDVVGNTSRIPMLVSDVRPYVNLNTAGGGNSSSAAGNILKQAEQQVTSGLGLSVNIVVEPIFKGTLATTSLHIFDFGKSKLEADQVVHAMAQNDASNNTLVSQYFSKDGAVVNILPVSSPVLRKDNVVHLYCKDDDFAVTSSKNSATSDTYVDKATTTKLKLSDSFTDSRQLTIASRTTSNGDTTMSNFAVYDIFILRDVKDLETSLLVRNFLDAELRAKFGNR